MSATKTYPDKEYYGKKNPVLTDVVLTESLVHNKQLAPKDCVYLICKIKYKDKKYTRAIRLNRKGLDNEQMDQIRHKAKVDFLTSIIDMIGNNKPVTLKDRIKKMITGKS